MDTKNTIALAETNRVKALVGWTATVSTPMVETDSAIIIGESEITYTDGHSINHSYPHNKLIALINFLESCGSVVTAN